MEEINPNSNYRFNSTNQNSFESKKDEPIIKQASWNRYKVALRVGALSFAITAAIAVWYFRNALNTMNQSYTVLLQELDKTINVLERSIAGAQNLARAFCELEAERLHLIDILEKKESNVNILFQTCMQNNFKKNVTMGIDVCFFNPEEKGLVAQLPSQDKGMIELLKR